MFCRSCGQVLAEGSVFCAKCGTAVATASATSNISGAAAAPAQISISKTIHEEVKLRTMDAWQGIKLFAQSPVGGLPQSFEMFDPARAMRIGIVFGILYEVTLFLGLYRLADKLTSTFGGELPLGDLSAKHIFQLIIIGLVPFVTLAASSAIARKIFRGKGAFAGDVYTAGASLLPLGLFALVSSLVGPANIEVIVVLWLFAVTYMILMLYAGCSRIAGIPEAGAAPAVPIMLLLSAWLTKVVITSFVTNM